MRSFLLTVLVVAGAARADVLPPAPAPDVVNASAPAAAVDQPQAAPIGDEKVRAVAQVVGASVVRLGTFDHDGKSSGNGTGFLVSADGVVVTNHHVVDKTRAELFAVFRDGKRVPVVGTLALDEDHDLALLKIDGSGYPALELADAADVVVGRPAILVGSPYGLDQSVGVGIVAALRPDGIPEDLRPRRRLGEKDREPKGQLVQHTVTAAPGASGSAVVDERGKVIGVHHSGHQGSEINFAAHVAELRALIARTDLKAQPVPVGRSVRTNLIISAVFFGAILAGIVLVPPLVRLVARRRRRRPRLDQ